MKYAISVIALALNLGVSAQAGTPAAVDVNAGATGDTTQAGTPNVVGASATTTGGATQAAISDVNASAPGGTMPANAPNAVDVNSGATTSAAQPTATASAVDLGAGTTVTGAQAAAPTAVALNTGSPVAGAQGTSPGAVDLQAGTSSGETEAPSRFAVELHAGTSGGGGQVEFFFNDYFAARVSGDWLRVDASVNSIDIENVALTYSGHANWATGGAFVDLHPLKDGWFLSGGAFDGNRNASFAGAPTQNVIIDGYTFTPADIGTVMGTAKLPNTSPFVGLGWDQAQHDRSGVTFRILAGAAFGGAKVTLWDVGPYSGTAIVQQWTAQEEASAQSKVNGWTAYPVMQLGVGYRF